MFSCSFTLVSLLYFLTECFFVRFDILGYALGSYKTGITTLLDALLLTFFFFLSFDVMSMHP